MDKLLQFSDYDVFGCLATGLAALALYDLVAGTHLALGAQWSVSDGVVVIFAAYVVGQILAAPASWVLERGLVGGLLGRPVRLLIQDRPSTGVRAILSRSILGEYFTPLPVSVRKKLRSVAGANLDDPQGLFYDAMAATNTLTLVRSKMETFLRLYGFCRNASFVSLTGAILHAGKGALEWNADPVGAASTLKLATLFLIVGLGLLHRYLKFFRLYSLTLLANYASVDSNARIGAAVHDAD